MGAARHLRLPLGAACLAIGLFALGLGSTLADDTYRLRKSELRRTGDIALAQMELPEVWESGPLSVLIPNERKVWAMAAVHAAQLFRNVTGVEDPYLDANHYIATAIQESRLGADPASAKFSYQRPASFPIYYVPGADGDGFMQIAGATAFEELKVMFPNRFGAREHAALVAGPRFATSALTAAYYNIFAYQFLVGGDWKPGAFAAEAKDPQALERVIAFGYNRGIWGDAVAHIFTDGRKYCLKQKTMADEAGKCMPNVGDEGSRYLRQVPGFDRLLVKAAAKGRVAYPGVYDAKLRKVDIIDYLEAIAPLYSADENARARHAALKAFEARAGGSATISFRSGFGPVLDAIMLALPVDSATDRLCSVYGKCAQEQLSQPQAEIAFRGP